MAKKRNLKAKIEYKDLSGDKTITPGQFRLDIEGGNLNGYVEQRSYACNPYAARAYWDAFKEFLNASGAFSRTWFLYKAINVEDPDPEYLKIMVEKHACANPDELFAKSSKDWDNYKRKLNTLISKAEKAKVPINLPKGEENQAKYKRNILISFVLLDDCIRGSARRQFYREKYIDRALNRIKSKGYADPVSIYEMENAFKADQKWQEHYLADQERRKEKEREKRKNRKP